jgi:hypothetical protein
MTKAAMACPFSNKACTECALYRGRHHYLSFSKPGRDCADDQEELGKTHLLPLSVQFQALKKSAEPWSGKSIRTKEPEIRLKVIDMESGETRICDLNEAKKWDWSNPGIWRLIDGWQIASLERLIEILCHKAETGHEEVELYEAPRFMFLAGG